MRFVKVNVPWTVGFLLVLACASGAAEVQPLQATAVYGVIATDPIYLWIAQERGFFKKNGLNIELTHIPTNQAVQARSAARFNLPPPVRKLSKPISPALTQFTY